MTYIAKRQNYSLVAQAIQRHPPDQRARHDDDADALRGQSVARRSVGNGSSRPGGLLGPAERDH
jgi:hypothetical protein